MYPNDARLRGLTYASNILCNIGIVYIIDGESKPIVRNYKKRNVGQIPIMVHSNQCILRGLDDINLNTMGECPYDQGGYFIVKGKEKVVLSQEKKVNNILYINESGDEKIILQGNIKSVSDSGFQSSRTNLINYKKNNLKLKI